MFLSLSASGVARAEDAALSARIASILEGRTGTYSAAILDLETGDTTVINGDETFHWASTVKLPLVLYTFIQVGDGAAELTDTITYTRNDYESGSGRLQQTIKVGDRYSISYLTKVAIINSDNIAKLMLLHHWGRSTIEAWAATLGGRFSADGLHAEEMLIYLRYLYAHRDQPLMRRFIDDLNHTPKLRIGRFLPKGLVLAAKGGSLPGEFHNAGIIFAERPVALAIYSKGTNESTSAYVEGLIGKAVYDEYRVRVSPRIFYGDSEIPFSEGAKPLLAQGTTLVPLRQFAEAAGFAVAWDEATMTASLSGPDATASFSVGSTQVIVSGRAEPVVMSRPILLLGNRTYIPLRAVSEALGLKVTWDQESTTVHVDPTP